MKPILLRIDFGMKEDACNTELGLGLGGDFISRRSKKLITPSAFHFFVKEEQPGSSPIMEQPGQEIVSVPRKKLRLTKEQSTLLEERYRSHSNLTKVLDVYNQLIDS